MVSPHFGQVKVISHKIIIEYQCVFPFNNEHYLYFMVLLYSNYLF